MTARFDIVGFDPRGTGGSSPVDCLDDADLDAFISGNVAPAEFWAGCQARSGDLLEHVGTVDAARDLDVLRAVVGEKRLNYLGFSYGTLLGATYAELFPSRVGRFVLDGAIDPAQTRYDRTLTRAAAFEDALEDFLRDCTSRACLLGFTVREGLATVAAVLEGLERRPLRTGWRRPVTLALAFIAITGALSYRADWPILDEGLQQATFERFGTALLELADYYTARTRHGYTDNGMEAGAVIECLDDPSSVTAAELVEYYPAFERVAPTLGRLMASGLISCAGAPAAFTENYRPLVIDAAGAAPILVLGSTGDPATPLSGARALADQLQSGVLLIRDGPGHVAYGVGNRCVDDRVHAYLLTGRAPDRTVRC